MKRFGETAALWNHVLGEADSEYAICGGVAVSLHGYQRNTIGLDLVIRRKDTVRIRELLESAGLTWDQSAAEFRTQGGVALQFLLAGESAGRGTGIRIPVPAGDENVEDIEGLTVLRLSRLIEMKLACGSANLRRTHKDYADVVELIEIRQLDGSFAGFLDKSLRKTFRELVRRVQVDSE